MYRVYTHIHFFSYIEQYILQTRAQHIHTYAYTMTPCDTYVYLIVGCGVWQYIIPRVCRVKLVSVYCRKSLNEMAGYKKFARCEYPEKDDDEPVMGIISSRRRYVVRTFSMDTPLGGKHRISLNILEHNMVKRFLNLDDFVHDNRNLR